MDEQDWYEKDLNDFADPQFSDEQEIILPKPKQSSKQIWSIENTYPFDLWYLIGMYIPPEDIGRFALICRTTNDVINTGSFWISLFKRYNKLEAKRLSRMLIREHCSIVRMYVIKSLYEDYSIFRERFNKSDAIQKDPHFLLSSRCIRIWYSKGSKQTELYNYYFQFRFDNNNNIPQQSDLPIQVLSPKFQINNQFTISKDTCILHLISSNFIPIGPYMGMILSRIMLTMSSDYRYHKLKMWFDSSKLSIQQSKYNSSVIIIDPILCLRIYKWYNIPNNLD